VTFASRGAVAVPGCRSLAYGPRRDPSDRTHPYAQSFDRAVLNAQGFAIAALAAARTDPAPDIVVSHAGPGAGLYARDVFRGVRTVAYAEWWYAYPAPDLIYLGEPSGALSDPDQAMVEHSRNASMALEIACADAVFCPTQFQANRFPAALRARISIRHDGIDTTFFRPATARSDDSDSPVLLRGLDPSTPLVTYATRGMEPHRGFPHLMAALPAIQASHPGAIIAIAGDASVVYGTDRMRGIDWLARGLATPGLDRTRIVLLGTLPAASYRWLLRRSDAHIYLTAPFVLSWSMLEAMATACPLVLSDTAPVVEFADARCATLVDMRDPVALARAVAQTLDDRDAGRRSGAAARAVVEHRTDAATLHAEAETFLLNLA
jgi:glycosyltransferase involved in cell wall biosynthesis